MSKTVEKVFVGDGVYAEFYGDDLFGIYIDTDRWLESLADFDDVDAQALQSKYEEFAEKSRNDLRWAYDVDIWADFREANKIHANADKYGHWQGWEYTYNHETDLNRDVHLYYFDHDDEEYVAVMDGDFRIGRVYEGPAGYRVEVTVAGVESPQDEALFDTPRPEPDCFYDLHEFQQWLDKNKLDVDWSERDKPKLTNGRNVYFTHPDIY